MLEDHGAGQCLRDKPYVVLELELHDHLLGTAAWETAIELHRASQGQWGVGFRV